MSMVLQAQVEKGKRRGGGEDDGMSRSSIHIADLGICIFESFPILDLIEQMPRPSL